MSLTGAPLPRREDSALLTGRGEFLDDARLAGLAHAYVLRSPLAHARLNRLDVGAARSATGVLAVLTAADLAGVGPVPGVADPLPGTAGQLPDQPVLARERVLWAGQPVAVIVAESPALAADAAELIDADYDPLPAVTQALAALATDAPVLHAGMSGNVCMRQRITAGDAAAAFASAAHRVRQTMTSQRLAPVTLEPRGVLAYERDGRLHVRIGTQRPHGTRRWLSGSLGLPEDAIRVVTGDVGGGFGSKGLLYPDQIAVVAAARILGRPVKWVEERGESFVATTHGRDQLADLEMALDVSGRITAIRGTVAQCFGAYLTPHAPAGLLNRTGPLLPQCYTVDSVDIELTGVFTNTTPLGPYRGAGRPEAAYYCERLIDLAATAAGLSPEEIRRRNFIGPDRFPYRTCTGLTYDSGNYPAALDRALELAGPPSPGEFRGRGLAAFVEPGGIVATERATAAVSADGRVRVAVGTSSHGQGHETAFAQLAADLLGVPYANVTVSFGDTDTAPEGSGTFGSRSAVVGGSAVHAACSLLRASGPGEVTAVAETSGVTYASGVYVADVVIDPDTGRVTVTRVIAVDDCGRVINPLIVEGQVHGAIAQGLGQALCEQVDYDDSGQPLAGSLMDYAVPMADSMPSIVTDRLETPSPFNPLGVKGMGESGTIGVTPAIVNAVLDALRPYGIRHLDMPLTAEKVWRAIHSAEARGAPDRAGPGPGQGGR